jgi:hypothetical protein
MPIRRFVMLLGAARSGTTWLGNILNSFPTTVYAHEPMMRPPDGSLNSLLGKIKKTGALTAAERATVLDYWSRAHFTTQKPPFFPKSYTRWPAKAMWAAWLAVRATDRGQRLFQALFSPPAGASFDLVVKQGGLTRHCRQFVEALLPHALIVIVRHPCGVIASMRRGQQLGLMAKMTREWWLDRHLEAVREFGYERGHVLSMTDAEFESLQWLVETACYKRLAEQHPNGHVVVYRDLCERPLAITESIAGALRWEVSEQTLRFVGESSASRPVASKLSAGHSYFSVYRPRQDSVSAWSRELRVREQEEIAAVAAPLVRHYWPESGSVSA